MGTRVELDITVLKGWVLGRVARLQRHCFSVPAFAGGVNIQPPVDLSQLDYSASASHRPGKTASPCSRFSSLLSQGSAFSCLLLFAYTYFQRYSWPILLTPSHWRHTSWPPTFPNVPREGLWERRIPKYHEMMQQMATLPPCWKCLKMSHFTKILGSTELNNAQSVGRLMRA